MARNRRSLRNWKLKLCLSDGVIRGERRDSQPRITACSRSKIDRPAALIRFTEYPSLREGVSDLTVRHNTRSNTILFPLPSSLFPLPSSPLYTLHAASQMPMRCGKNGNALRPQCRHVSAQVLQRYLHNGVPLWLGDRLTESGDGLTRALYGLAPA